MQQHPPHQLGGYPPPLLNATLPVARDPTALGVNVNLCKSTEFDDCNVDFAISSIIKKASPTEHAVSVAAFNRSVVLKASPDWILRLIRRHRAMRKRGKSSFLLTFGDGEDILILLDAAPPPKDLSKIPRHAIWASFFSAEEDGTNIPLANPNDEMWDHALLNAGNSSFISGMMFTSPPGFESHGEINQEKLEVIKLVTVPKELFTCSKIEHCSFASLSRDEPHPLEEMKKLTQVSKAGAPAAPAAGAVDEKQSGLEQSSDDDVRDNKKPAAKVARKAASKKKHDTGTKAGFKPALKKATKQTASAKPAQPEGDEASREDSNTSSSEGKETKEKSVEKQGTDAEGKADDDNKAVSETSERPDEAAPAKKRGRPKASKTTKPKDAVADEKQISGEKLTKAGTPKKRGRPKGSKNKKPKTPAGEDANAQDSSKEEQRPTPSEKKARSSNDEGGKEKEGLQKKETGAQDTTPKKRGRPKGSKTRKSVADAGRGENASLSSPNPKATPNKAAPSTKDSTLEKGDQGSKKKTKRDADSSPSRSGKRART